MSIYGKISGIQNLISNITVLNDKSTAPDDRVKVYPDPYNLHMKSVHSLIQMSLHISTTVKVIVQEPGITNKVLLFSC